MSKEKEMPPDTVKIITMLRIDDNTVVDSEELTSEQKEAYIEFAIHLVAPKISGILAGHTNPITEQKMMDDPAIDASFFNYPPMAYSKTGSRAS